MIVKHPHTEPSHFLQEIVKNPAYFFTYFILNDEYTIQAIHWVTSHSSEIRGE